MTPLPSSFSRSRVHPTAAALLLPVVAELSVAGLVGPQALLATVAVGILVAVGWWSWRTHRRGGAESPVSGMVESTATAAGGEESSESARYAKPDAGFVRSSVAEDEASEEHAFFSGDDVPPRTCPECERVVPGIFDVCPFDSTPLEDGNSRRRKGSEELLPRKYCPDCGRRYELHAEHCYHDGQLLRRDDEQAARDAGVFRVCRDCGWETTDDVEICPRDGEPLVVIDPMSRKQVRPVIPYNRCRDCGYLGEPGQTHCPNDGSFLLPELDAGTTALPPTGYGPRRQVCPECGTRFGDHCNHCSSDGTELIALN